MRRFAEEYALSNEQFSCEIKGPSECGEVVKVGPVMSSEMKSIAAEPIKTELTIDERLDRSTKRVSKRIAEVNANLKK